MHTNISCRRIKDRLFLWPAWQLWLLTVFLIGIFITGWFVWFYSPLIADMQCLRSLYLQQMHQKKLIALYKTELHTLQALGLKELEPNVTNNRDSLIKHIALDVQSRNIFLKECRSIDRRSDTKKTSCTWCIEGEREALFAYIEQLMPYVHHNVLSRLSCKMLTGNQMQIQGIFTEL